MRDLALFGTNAYPIHPSGIHGLITCPWQAAAQYVFAEIVSEQEHVSTLTPQDAHDAVNMHLELPKVLQPMHVGTKIGKCISKSLLNRRRWKR